MKYFWENQGKILINWQKLEDKIQKNTDYKN